MRVPDAALALPPRELYPTCNGLQSKWARTAISGNWGPHYLQLSIAPGPHYLQLRLLLPGRACNQRPQDHIICDETKSPSPRPVRSIRSPHAPESVLEVLLSRTTLDLDTGASHHTQNYPIETPQLSLPLCPMRVYLHKTDLPPTIFADPSEN